MVRMTDLAYMVREDWAQRGTAMIQNSARIREWLGPQPYVFAVTDVTKFNERDHDADLETAMYISPEAAGFEVCNLDALPRLRDTQQAIVLLHPYGERTCDQVRAALLSASVRRVFIMICARGNMVRVWADALGAIDLRTGHPLPAPDPLLKSAAELMVDQQYNGLSSGIGKATVVGRLRALTASGYPLNKEL